MTPDELDALPDELKALLDAERAPMPAPAAAKARVMAKLTSQLFPVVGGGGSGDGSHQPQPTQPSTAPTSAGTAATGGAATATSATLVTKFVVGVGVASFAVGGVVGAGVHAVVAAPVAQTASASPVREPAPVVVAPTVPPVAEPVVAPPQPVVVAATVPTAKPEKPRGPTTADTLADERSLVDTARTALSRDDATAALDALAQHERRFPSGQLAEERLALQVLALTRAGRTDDARARARVFRQKFPSGLFRAVVDDAAPEAP